MEEWLKKLLYGKPEPVYSDIPKDDRWYDKALDMEGRYTILPLKDVPSGTGENKREWALPGLLAEAVNAVTAPKRSLTAGLLEPDAPNFALNMMGGGLLSSRAIKAPTGEGGADLGMFAGKNAKTADMEALARLNELQTNKTPASESFKETGWMQGAEGKPRFEISDDTAKVTAQGMGLLDYPTVITKDDLMRLENVIDHPELFKAYPQLRDVGVGMHDNAGIVGGYDPTNNLVLLGGEYRQSFKDAPETMRDTLLHEIQHAIQRIEGFEKGGSSRVAPDVLTKQAHQDFARFDPDLLTNYKKASKKFADAGEGLYMYQLDKISQAENIKPSSVTNLSDWYAYSDKIRSELGPAPTKPGAARDSWYRNAAKWIKDKNIEDRPYLANYKNLSEKELNAIYRTSKNQTEKMAPAYRDMQKTIEKYQNLNKKTDYELYERLAGEAEARLTETRRAMTPAQRREKFPFEQLDVPYGELLYRSLLK